MPPELSPDYVKLVNKTSRHSGAVGKDPVCYRELDNILFLQPDDTYPIRILDYGCGKNGTTRGIIFVDRHPKKIKHYIPYDIGNNRPQVDEESLRKLAEHLSQPFDIVILSNVLNVQPDWRKLDEVLFHAWSYVKDRGRLLVNYPAKPRYSAVTDSRLRDYLEDLPRNPKVIPRGKSLYEVTKIGT